MLAGGRANPSLRTLQLAHLAPASSALGRAVGQELQRRVRQARAEVLQATPLPLASEESQAARPMSHVLKTRVDDG